MSGFELYLGVAAYSAAKFILGVVLFLLFMWSIWGLYKDRKGLKEEANRLEKSDDHTIVDIIGYKTVKRTLWKLFFFTIIFIFAKSGVVKMVEADDTKHAREAMSYQQESQRTRVAPLPTAAELRAKRLEEERAAKAHQAKLDAEEVAAQKTKSEKAIKDSLENQKQ